MLRGRLVGLRRRRNTLYRFGDLLGQNGADLLGQADVCQAPGPLRQSHLKPEGMVSRNSDRHADFKPADAVFRVREDIQNGAQGRDRNAGGVAWTLGLNGDGPARAQQFGDRLHGDELGDERIDNRESSAQGARGNAGARLLSIGPARPYQILQQTRSSLR